MSSRRSECVRTSVDDLTDAREQPGIFKYRLAHGDAVLTELASFPDQPGSMGQCSHRNWSVVRPHAAKFVAGYERRLRAQFCRTAAANTPAGPAPMTMTSITLPSVTLALVKAASCVLATKGGMAWAQPAAFVLVVHSPFPLAT